MCIILTCEKNVRPDHDMIETCFWNNPDGAGIMWVEDGKVQIAKGFMDEESLEAAIASVPLESPLVIHMRIATSGGVNVGTCHPFPVCRNLDALHAPNVECRAAVAHNGVIYGVPTDDKKGISDTVYFVSHEIADMWRKDNKVTKKLRRRITHDAPANRFAIMTEDGRVFRLGSGWESVSRGIEASNSTWRHSFRSKWSKWDYLWDDFEDVTDEYEKLGYDVDNDYAAAVDRMCPLCDYRTYCRVYGAMCDDVAQLIDDELYEPYDYNRYPEVRW